MAMENRIKKKMGKRKETDEAKICTTWSKVQQCMINAVQFLYSISN